MARIRTIKPEFPQSESVGRLSRDARLLFIQLWTIVDDYGRARAATRYLAGQLYPYDDDAPKLIGKWLSQLEADGFIRLYEVNGNKYLDIPTWAKHQRIDNAGKSNIPEYRGEPDDARGESPRTAANGGDSPLDLGPRNGEDLGYIRAVAVATRPDDPFDELWKSYPKRDGANPKTPARKKFLAAVKSGVDPVQIISGARRYAAEMRSKAQEGTPYVAQLVTWLNQQRWGDYAVGIPTTGPPKPPVNGLPSDDELRKRYGNPGRQNTAESTAVPGPGDRLCGETRDGICGDQKGYAGSGSVDGLLPVARLRSMGDARAEIGADRVDDGPDAVA